MWQPLFRPEPDCVLCSQTRWYRLSLSSPVSRISQETHVTWGTFSAFPHLHSNFPQSLGLPSWETRARDFPRLLLAEVFWGSAGDAPGGRNPPWCRSHLRRTLTDGPSPVLGTLFRRLIYVRESPRGGRGCPGLQMNRLRSGHVFKARAWQSWDLNSGLSGFKAGASCIPLPAAIMYLMAYSFSCLVVFFRPNRVLPGQ